MTQSPKALVHSGASASIPSEIVSPNNARTVASLQALTLALRIGGLDGLRSGAVKMGGGDDGER